MPKKNKIKQGRNIMVKSFFILINKIPCSKTILKKHTKKLVKTAVIIFLKQNRKASGIESALKIKSAKESFKF